ncbi:MAG TPA: xanthine dehydrogenase family protein molybdopterin-binding subunit [Bryobacteraceae bacterium]|nr:xanthine dehydrogenase family protein molybdopterin-binding subunit [Bryobacteraceae bacterium]
MNALKTVGHPASRIDAVQRVTGKAKYTYDVHVDGMLYARVLRSPHPHARIRRMDTSKAAALPGVKTILTHENCDIVWGSGDTKNKRYLFNNPVRFAGDAVAAVAAVDRHTAEEATRLIDVDYEVLPFVLDPEAALKPDAVQIQPGGNLSQNNKGEREPETYRHGNVEKGFSQADRVYEDQYSSVHLNNAQLEIRSGVAHWDGDKLTVYSPTQGIANCRMEIAHDLSLPLENVRVITEFMGGGFGNKNQCQDSDLIVAMLAKKAGAPVKLEFTRKEDFLAVHGRWPTKQYYKVGVKNDGTLTAIQFRGYSGMGPYRKSSGDIAGVELYQCPHVEKLVYPVLTNMAVSANLRGPAYPQGIFGIESLMDHIAYELKMDPVDFRVKNMTRKYHDQVPYTSFGLEECVLRGAEAFEWKKRWHEPGAGDGPVKRGVGLAMGAFSAAVGRSSAVIHLNSQGQYELHVGVTDIGTAAKTTMALIAAEELGVPLSKVSVVSGDSATCPYSVGESGSRTTTHTGYAVIQAVKDLKQQIADKGLPQGSDVRTGTANSDPAPSRDSARYAFAAHFAEVEVDTEMGHARVTKFLAAHDSGRIINPLTCASQVKGGSVMGIGMALHEELLYDQAHGIALNAGYYGARVMTHLDAPEIGVLFVETEDQFGPYGAKSIGESSIIPSVAAVANAIFNATGKRIKDLPITREKLLEVLA